MVALKMLEKEKNITEQGEDKEALRDKLRSFGLECLAQSEIILEKLLIFLVLLRFSLLEGFGFFHDSLHRMQSFYYLSN